MTTFSPSIFSPAKRLSQKIIPQRFVAPQAGRGMLIVIDANVDHGDALAAGTIRGSRLLMLDSERDAIGQITQEVHRFPGKFKSLHIVTHGSPGCLHFSSGDLDLSNLHTYATEIESWFSYQPIRRGSDIRVQSVESSLSLYACSLAMGDVGEEFIEKLQFLSGVSVHASQGKVGSTALDGSWQLEVAHPFPRQVSFPFTEDLLDTYEAVA